MNLLSKEESNVSLASQLIIFFVCIKLNLFLPLSNSPFNALEGVIEIKLAPGKYKSYLRKWVQYHKTLALKY